MSLLEEHILPLACYRAISAYLFFHSCGICRLATGFIWKEEAINAANIPTSRSLATMCSY